MASKRSKPKKSAEERLRDFVAPAEGGESSIGEIFLGDFTKPGDFGLTRQKNPDKSIGLASNREDLAPLPNIEASDLGEAGVLRKLK